MNSPTVVAVSGISGAGKTTIVKKLANEFDCPRLHFDEHTDNNTYPHDMKAWLASGANVSLIRTPKLVTALAQTIEKRNSRYIFIEEPFGKARDAMSSMIDYVIWLDQAMELCLARIIKRHTDKPHSDSLDVISSFLNKYEDHYRDIYKAAASQVITTADLIVKEGLSIDQTTQCISNWLKTNTN